MRSRCFRLLAPLLALAFAAGAGPVSAAALESTPQVQTYRALLRAMKSGDYPAYRRLMVKEAGPLMDEQTRRAGKSPREVLALMTKMTPSDVSVTDLEIRGNRATLHASGRIDGEMNYAVVDLTEQDGQWKVERQSWSTRPDEAPLIA